MHATKLSQLIQAALAHHQNMRLPQAEAIYRQILNANPSHSEAMHYLGLIALQFGKYQAATELIGKSIDISPSHTKYYNLGNTLQAQGKMSEAAKNYLCALALKPGYAEAHINLGNVLQAQGNLDEAVGHYQKGTQSKPSNAEAHYNLGTALLAQGKRDAAIESLRKAAKLKPDHAETHFNLGNALKEQNRHNEAAASYRKAISLKPVYFEAYYNLGLTLREYGMVDEAVASYRKALSLNPGFAAAYNDLGIALQDRGEMEEAIACYRKALAINPDNADVLCNLHALLLNLDDMDPAIECMKRAVEIKPENPLFRLYLGVALDYSGDSDEAAPHFDVVENSSGLIRAKLDAWRYLKSAGGTGRSVEQRLNALTWRHLKSTGGTDLPITGCTVQAFKLGMDAALLDGLVLEFGVRFGTSIRQIAALAKQQVHGFDSFEGIPEAWHHEAKGSYSTNGTIPDVPDNVTLHAGWFEDTLPRFLDKFQGPVRFVNIDCDLYSSTKTILDGLASRIVPGTVIVFDEYVGNEFWREDEFKAFQEAAARYGWNYSYLSFSLWTKQVVVRIH